MGETSKTSFRGNIGAVILEPGKEKVLAFEMYRDGKFMVGTYQLPQEGIEEDEITPTDSFLDTLWRGLREETGLTQRELALVGEHPRWITCYVPFVYRNPNYGLGQNHLFYYLLLKKRVIEVEQIDLSKATGAVKEFSSVRAMSFEDLDRCCLSFQRDMYEELAGYVRKHNFFKCRERQLATPRP